MHGILQDREITANNTDTIDLKQKMYACEDISDVILKKFTDELLDVPYFVQEIKEHTLNASWEFPFFSYVCRT